MDLSFPDYKSIDELLDDYPGFYLRMPFVILYSCYKTINDCFRISSNIYDIWQKYFNNI